MRDAQAFSILLVISSYPDLVGFRGCIILFSLASAIGSVTLGKFSGNKYFRIEIACALSIRRMFKF
jgi:hypothetical protein